MKTPTKNVPYAITLEVNAGEVYKSKGATIHEALDGLDMDYTKVKTKGTISLTHGTKKSSKFFYLPQLRRIVVNKLRKYAVGRDLIYLLK
jgi:rhamnogalacturonyl hydrolase YesR